MGGAASFSVLMADGDLLLNRIDDQIILYDTSDQTKLTFINSFSTGLSVDWALFQDGILYTTTYQYNSFQLERNILSIWDFRNPSSPLLKARRNLYHSSRVSTEMRLVGNTLVVAQDNKTLNLYDVSNLSRPLLKNTAQLPDTASKMHADGQRLYVLVQQSPYQMPRLLTFNIATNHTAQLLSTYTPPEEPLSSYNSRIGLTSYNNTVYLSFYSKTYVINVTPASPSLLFTHTADVTVQSLEVFADQQILVQSTAYGISHLFDISVPAQMDHIKNLSIDFLIASYSDSKVWYHDDESLVAADISDITDPQELYSIENIEGGNTLNVVDDIAYIGWGGGYAGGITTLDLTNPEAPSKLDNYDIHGGINKVQVIGNKLYPISGQQGTTNFSSSFYVFNIADPSNIQLLGSRSFPYLLTGFEVSGSYAYLSKRFDDAGNSALHTVNITNPSTLTIANTITSTNDKQWSITQISNGRLYVAQTNRISSANQTFVQEQLVYSLTNPAQPTQIGTLPYAFSYNIEGTIVGNTLYYTGNHPQGIPDVHIPRIGNQHYFEIIDISNPAQPVLKSRIPRVYGCKIGIEGDLAYINTCRGELIIFDISDSSKPKRISTLSIGIQVNDFRVDNSNIYLLNIFSLQIYRFSTAGLTANQVTQVEAQASFPSSFRTYNGLIGPSQLDEPVPPQTELIISTLNADGTVIPSNAVIHLYEGSGNSTIPTYVVFTPDAQGQMRIPVTLPPNQTVIITVNDYERGIGTNIVLDTTAYLSYLPILTR